MNVDKEDNDSETIQQPLTPFPEYLVMPILTCYDLAAIRRIVREELEQVLTLRIATPAIEHMARKLRGVAKSSEEGE